MKFSVSRSAMLEALGIVSQVINSRSPKEVLKCVKFAVAGDWLTLTATDYEITIRQVVPIKDAENGEFLLLPDEPMGLLKISEADDVQFEGRGDFVYLLLNGDNDDFEFKTYPIAEFPDVASVVDEPLHHRTISAGDLSKAWERCSFAADKQDGTARWTVKSVAMEVDGPAINFVATDTRRLSLQQTQSTDRKAEPDAKNVKGLSLIPPGAFSTIYRSLNESTEQVEIKVTDKAVQFKTERTEIFAKLAEGRFPPYRDIIPKSFTSSLVLSMSKMLDAFRKIAVMTDNESKRAEVTIDGDKLTITAQKQTGKGEVTLPIEGYTGKKFVLRINPTYVIDMLRVMSKHEDTNITFKFIPGAELKPVVFQHADGFEYLQMPMAN